MAKNVRRATKSKMAMESVEAEVVPEEYQDVIQLNSHLENETRTQGQVWKTKTSNQKQNR